MTTMQSMLPKYTAPSTSGFISADRMATAFEAANPFKTLSDAFNEIKNRHDKEYERVENQRRYDQEFALKQAAENRAQQTHELTLEDRLRAIDQEKATNLGLSSLMNPSQTHNNPEYAMDVTLADDLARFSHDLTNKGITGDKFDKAVMARYNALANQQVMNDPNVNQASIFDAKNTLFNQQLNHDKHEETKRHNKVNESQKQQTINATNQAIERQDNLAQAYLNAIQEGIITEELPNQAKQDTLDSVVQLSKDVARQEALLNSIGSLNIGEVSEKELTTLVSDLNAEKEKLDKINAINEARIAHNQGGYTNQEGKYIPNRPLELMDVPTSNVNDRLLQLVGNDKNAYDAIIADPSLLSTVGNSEEIQKTYQGNLDKLATLADTYTNTSDTVSNTRQLTARELFDREAPNLGTPTEKLQFLSLVGGLGDYVGNTSKTSSKSTKASNSLGNLFGSSTEEKELTTAQLNRIDKQTAGSDKLQIMYNKIEEKQGKEEANSFINSLSKNEITSPEGVTELFDMLYNKDGKKKDQLTINVGRLEAEVGKIVGKEKDKDNDTSNRLQDFISENKTKLAKMSESEMTTFINKLVNRYQEQGTSWYNNMVDGAPIGDALHNLVTEDPLYKDWSYKY